jgi:hypothetical protein
MLSPTGEHGLAHHRDASQTETASFLALQHDLSRPSAKILPTNRLAPPQPGHGMNGIPRFWGINE